MRVVARERIGDAGNARVQIAAPEVFRADRLAGGGLDQRRAGEKDRALLLDDDRLVRHRGHVGAARGAGPHDDRDLRNSCRGHARLIVEDPAEMLAVRKHFGLVRQIGPARVDEVNARQAVLRRDFLRAQMFLDRHRIIGAAFDRRIVGDDHRFAAVNESDPRDQARAVHVAFVHAVGGERADFEKGRTRIDEPRDALAREKLAARDVALARLGGAALGGRAPTRVEFVDDPAPADGVRLVLVRSSA